MRQRTWDNNARSVAGNTSPPASDDASILRPLAPSRTLVEFVDKIARFGKAPALDVACGFGRNAFLLAAHGRDVVCVDRDLARLRTLQKMYTPLLGRDAVADRPGSIVPICITVNSSSWPFRAGSFGLVISAHFVDMALFDNFAACLIPSGYLYIETFGGQGGNYVDLPHPGEVRAALSSSFTLEFYREKRLSRHLEAVTVKALARKRGA